MQGIPQVEKSSCQNVRRVFGRFQHRTTRRATPTWDPLPPLNLCPNYPQTVFEMVGVMVRPRLSNLAHASLLPLHAFLGHELGGRSTTLPLYARRKVALYGSGFPKYGNSWMGGEHVLKHILTWHGTAMQSSRHALKRYDRVLRKRPVNLA